MLQLKHRLLPSVFATVFILGSGVYHCPIPSETSPGLGLEKGTRANELLPDHQCFGSMHWRVCVCVSIHVHMHACMHVYKY